MTLTPVEEGIRLRQFANGSRRYYTEVRWGCKTYRCPTHSRTLEEARIKRETLRLSLRQTRRQKELGITHARIKHRLLRVLSEAITTNNVKGLGPVASLLLVALQRSRKLMGESLTLDMVLHPPACWDLDSRQLAWMFQRALIAHNPHPRN